MSLLKGRKLIALGLVASMLTLVGCAGNGTKKTEEVPKEAAKLAGTIKIDGSSTVSPITEAVAEEYKKEQSDVTVKVDVSGTGGGMKKFVVNEIDIANASREIKDEEKADADKNGVKYTELKVAMDGISVVVNPQNTWAADLTVDELKKMWSPDSKVKTWKDVRADWPNEPIKFYSPGTDSGTFEYFTEEIVGEKNKMRQDVTPSEDDNVLVTGVAGDKNAIGFFGFAYYEENADKLKLVKVDGVEPTADTIKSGTYKPLSRPLFIYVNTTALSRPEVKGFVQFYLDTAKDVAAEVGYVALDDAEYQKDKDSIK